MISSRFLALFDISHPAWRVFLETATFLRVVLGMVEVEHTWKVDGTPHGLRLLRYRRPDLCLTFEPRPRLTTLRDDRRGGVE